jgi:multidrug transporter EmrE-like cation transporter
MMMKDFWASWGMLIFSVAFNVIGVFVIKQKINELGIVRVESIKAVMSYFGMMMKSPAVLIAAVLFFSAPFFFVVALSRLDIVVAYPVQLGLNFILVILLATFFLGEAITLWKVLGMAFILIGICLINKTGHF